MDISNANVIGALTVGGDSVSNLNPNRGKNLLINGDFTFWQRGTSFSKNVYTADRWLEYTNGGDTVTTTRQSGGAGINYSGHNARYTLQMNITAGGGSNNNLIQYIEDVRTAQAKTVTLSLWTYTNVEYTLTPYLAQVFGSGGSSNVSITNTTAVIPATTWTKVVMTFDVPSISGKTIGAGDCLGLILEIPGNVTRAVYFMNVQLEEGDTATDFEIRPIAEELVLCQRYFEKSYNLTVTPGTAQVQGMDYSKISGSTLIKTIPFRVEKLTTPTMISYSPFDGAVGYCYDYNGTANIAISSNTASTTGFYSITAGATDQRQYGMHWTADAEF